MTVGTILIVEDETLIRMSLSEYLQEIGYKTLEATNGNEAKSILQANPVDLVLTDVRMDGHHEGIELVRWVRANKPDLPVVIVTGGMTPGEVFRELGGEQLVLTKPTDFAALRELIVRLLPVPP
jgi:CheY-like chemotaxis protein